MQQGKMFFFVGVAMASIQGGYARRIKPGHHVKAVRTVEGARSGEKKTPFAGFRGLLGSPSAIFFGRRLCFPGHRRADPGLSSDRTLVERHHALRRLGALLLW